MSDMQVEYRMLAFIDEAGDTGFKFSENSSPFFVMVMVVFQDAGEAENVGARIDHLRTELRLSPKTEFHFARNRNMTRTAFLSAVKNSRFDIFAVIVDKERLAWPEAADFYRFVCATVLESAKPVLAEATLYFDESGGERFKVDVGSIFDAEAEHARNAPHQENSVTKIRRQQLDTTCGYDLRGNLSFRTGEWGGDISQNNTAPRSFGAAIARIKVSLVPREICVPRAHPPDAPFLRGGDYSETRAICPYYDIFQAKRY